MKILNNTKDKYGIYLSVVPNLYPQSEQEPTPPRHVLRPKRGRLLGDIRDKYVTVKNPKSDVMTHLIDVEQRPEQVQKFLKKWGKTFTERATFCTVDMIATEMERNALCFGNRRRKSVVRPKVYTLRTENKPLVALTTKNMPIKGVRPYGLTIPGERNDHAGGSVEHKNASDRILDEIIQTGMPPLRGEQYSVLRGYMSVKGLDSRVTITQFLENELQDCMTEVKRIVAEKKEKKSQNLEQVREEIIDEVAKRKESAVEETNAPFYTFQLNLSAYCLELVGLDTDLGVTTTATCEPASSGGYPQGQGVIEYVEAAHFTPLRESKIQCSPSFGSNSWKSEMKDLVKKFRKETPLGLRKTPTLWMAAIKRELVDRMKSFGIDYNYHYKSILAVLFLFLYYDVGTPKIVEEIIAKTIQDLVETRSLIDEDVPAQVTTGSHIPEKETRGFFISKLEKEGSAVALAHEAQEQNMTTDRDSKQ